jgi:hypothetical protein
MGKQGCRVALLARALLARALLARASLACLCAALGTAGCAPSALPSLPSGSQAPTQTAIATEAGAITTATLTSPSARAAQAESTVMAAGTPTEVYALIARRILRCWFGADGPLKATHIFHADAASPSAGGKADIVLQERDPAFSDRRGPRAFRIAITGDAAGVRVGISNLKIAEPLAGLMVRDAETWARGGEGCETRTLKKEALRALPQRPANAVGEFDTNADTRR